MQVSKAGSAASKALAVLVPLFLFLTGCGGSRAFLDRSYDFGFIEKVAVIPFENLSQSQTAGRQATTIFITELLASEAFAVIEPGETVKAMADMNVVRNTALDMQQIKDLGKRLGAQALIFGTVSESGALRSGGASINTVTMDLRMVETETASTIWSATRTDGRPGLFATLFGLSAKSSAETMRQCSHQILKSLIK